MMPTAQRARLAVLLLAGCYAVAGAELLAVVAVVLILLEALSAGQAVAVAVPLCIAPVGALAYALRRALHLRHGAVTGLPVTRADAPDLWCEVDRLAAIAAARTPDALTVVADVCVTITERSHLLGLVGGRRELVIGLPVLQALDVDHLRALLAHELAHDSRLAGRWAAIAWRGRHALDRTVGRAGRRNLAAWPLRGYAKLVRRVGAPVVHAHELGADRVAARAAGPRAAAEALRDLPMLGVAQQLFHAEYLGPGWQAGHVPDDIFGGLLRMLAARAGDLAAWRARAVPAERDGLHPPMAERLAALAAAPPTGVPHQPAPAGAVPALAGVTPAGGTAAPAPTDAVGDDGAETPIGDHGRGTPEPGAPHGGRAAGELVPDLPGLGRTLQAVAFPPHGRSTLGWDEFFGAARTAEMEREADDALQALGRATGAPVAGLDGALDLAAADGLLPAVRKIFPELAGDGAAGPAAELVTLLLALAALRSGAGRWRHSWTGTAELVTVDGGPLDVGELADLAVRADGVPELRRRLRELGIDPRPVADRVPAGGAVVGGLVNLGVDGSRADLIVLDTGLVLVPGLPRTRAGEARQRLAQLAAADDAARLAAVPGTRFVPYAEVTGAEQTRRAPKAWQFELRDGGMLQVRAGLDSDELTGGWAALQDAVAFLAAGR